MSALMNGLVLDLDFTKGTLKDFSPHGNDGSMQSGEIFCRAEKANAVEASKNTAYLVVTDDPTLDLDAFTLVIFADFYKGFDTAAYLVDRSNGVNVDLQLRISAANTLTLDDGTDARTITVNPSDIRKKSTIIITKAAGSNTANLYIDGVLHGSFSGANNIATNGQNITLFATQAGASHFYMPVYSQLIYNVEKTAEEVGEIHYEVSHRITDRSSKRSFKNGQQMPRIASGFSWNMDLSDLSNLGPTTAPLSLVGSGNSGETIWGETAIEFNARTLLSGSGYLSGGDISELNFTTESFGGWMWVNIRDLSTYNPILLMKGSPSAAGFHLQCTGGVVAFATSQLGTNQQALGIPSIQEDYWQLVAFFSEAGGNNEVWINGQEGGFPIARTDPDSASGYNFTIGRHSTSTVGFIDGHIARVHIAEYSDRTTFLEAMHAELDHIGQNLLYREDFRDAFVHQNFISGTNLAIPGTELITDAVASTMKITDGDILGKKKLLGGAFSSACVTNHNGHPYGTYKITIDHVSGQRTRVGVYANEPANIAAKHLVIDCTGGGNARVELTLDGVLKMTSPISSVPLGKNTFYVVLKPYGSNNCSVYDENWNLLTAATGSNPFTVPINKDDHKFYIYAPYSNSGIYSLEHFVT